ncbi:unnamed protein product [Haemonchus placei]|uniref:SnoaL-like domain-containing protein n=1 Tax=Haemonchus placei TaxID=6290 RepID=A0A3P7USJ4_HAEPC|nr:unnamed protein product [Haemonchus placei]
MITTMKPDEARAALKPHYEALLKNMNEGKFEENFKHFHPHCAVVHRGKGAYYGKEQIGAMLKKLFEEQHPKNIKITHFQYLEIREKLKPIYEELEQNMTKGDLQANFKHLHSDCVIVQKGKEAYYGKERESYCYEIGNKMKSFFQEHQPKNIKRSKAVYYGCECCICVSVEVSFDTPKGPAKVDEHHIWRKENNDWKLYHIEYEMVH